jgi:hypothetical protein
MVQQAMHNLEWKSAESVQEQEAKARKRNETTNHWTYNDSPWRSARHKMRHELITAEDDSLSVMVIGISAPMTAVEPTDRRLQDSEKCQSICPSFTNSLRLPRFPVLSLGGLPSI